MNMISQNTHPTIISAEVADWSRETPQQFWDPGRKLLLAIRRYQRWRQRGGFLGSFHCKLLVIRHRFWSVVTAADIPLNCRIGGGLLIPHPNGIVIHPDAQIGVNCLIFQQVTIGTRETDGVPEIGGHVDIGAGAKILGQVTIGDHAKIGANAVVTRNIAAEAKAIGVG
jgi:serine O-acetyltransferase